MGTKMEKVWRDKFISLGLTLVIGSVTGFTTRNSPDTWTFIMISSFVGFFLCDIFLFIIHEYDHIKKSNLHISNVNHIDEKINKINEKIESYSSIHSEFIVKHQIVDNLVSVYEKSPNINVVNYLLGALTEFKELYTKADKKQKDFLDKIFDLKLGYFFKSSLIISPQDSNISKVPRYYFEADKIGNELGIWKWLLHNSNKYYSVQIVNKQTANIYLTNRKRTISEINFIKTEIKAKQSEIKKIFVIEDEWIEVDGDVIVVDDSVLEYIHYWIAMEKKIPADIKANVSIKCIKASCVNGSLGDRYEVDDFGLFDNILGIQEVIPKSGSLIDDMTNIKFFIDNDKIKEYYDSFNNLFVDTDAISLDTLFYKAKKTNS
jgi:hypothetical protein